MITRRLCAIAVSFPDARPFPIRAPHFNSHKGDASNAVKRKKTKKQERSHTHATQKARRPPRMYTRADKERNQRSRDVITVGHYPRFPCIPIPCCFFCLLPPISFRCSREQNEEMEHVLRRSKQNPTTKIQPHTRTTTPAANSRGNEHRKRPRTHGKCSRVIGEKTSSR